MSIKKSGVICECKIENFTYYLCVQSKDSGRWSFPKGHLENDETIYECAIRELQEETGLCINLLGIEEPISLLTNNTVYFHKEFSSLLDIFTQDKTEIKNIKWLSVMNLLGMDEKILNSDLNYFIDKNFRGKFSKDEFTIVVKKSKPKKIKVLCKYFVDGKCKQGKKCIFSHNI